MMLLAALGLAPGPGRPVRPLHGVLQVTGSARCGGGSGCTCTPGRGSPRSPSCGSAGRARGDRPRPPRPAGAAVPPPAARAAPPTTRSAWAAASGSAARTRGWRTRSSSWPRSGPASRGIIADRILDHPGPVLATSTRADLYESTAGARALPRPGARVQPAGRRRRPVDPAVGSAGPVPGPGDGPADGRLAEGPRHRR